MRFDHPKNQSSIIKVIGVGGGGSNAVTYMFRQGIRGVDFILANTDNQALEMSEVPVKIQLGANLTEGMGAGSIPEVGRQAAIESAEEVRKILETNTKMVFVTAGMGGGTGTGAAPVIASIAKELGVLTVGIVTIPFLFEGRKRREQADIGIQEMRKYVDTLLIICNDKLRELHGDLKLSEAFGKADNILTIAAKGIAEIITVAGYVNVDFNDVNTVMRNSGAAIMGTGIAEGEGRAVKAVEMALNSPLLNDSNIEGAKNILLYIASGQSEVTMDEVTEVTNYIQAEAGSHAEIIWGNGQDERLNDQIGVTIIATGFNADGFEEKTEFQEKKVIPLEIVNDEKKETQNDDFQVIVKDDTQDNPLFDFQKTEEEKTDEPNTVVEEFGGVKFEVKTIQPEDESKSNQPLVDSAEEVDNSNEYSFAKEKPLVYKTEEEKERHRQSLERIQRLRDLSTRIKSQKTYQDLESEPAYKRRNVELTDVKLSSESEVSRFVLGEDEEKKTELKNNSFLHDNVD